MPNEIQTSDPHLAVLPELRFECMVSVGLKTRTAIAATPDQRFPALACRAANWRHLAVSATRTTYVGVMALYKTPWGKSSCPSRGGFSAPRRQSAAGMALKSHNRESTMTKAPSNFEFGTFDERVEHFCAVLEIDPPEMVYEDGEPMLTQPLADWLAEHGADAGWVFLGEPSKLLVDQARSQVNARKFAETSGILEPEVQNGLLAVLRAVVDHGLPLEPSFEIFVKVVEDWRAAKAA